MVIRLRIEVRGKSQGDIESGLNEARQKVLDGFKWGFDCNEDADYTFRLEEGNHIEAKA